MATTTKTWQIIDGELKPVESTLSQAGRTEPYDLEQWIASDSAILGPELLIIGRQVSTESGPLDLLAVDSSGNLVIVELKRDKLPREALVQAIDYASDVASWSTEKISETCSKHTGKDLDDALTDAFPEIDLEAINLNETQRILLVGFSIEGSLERMIEWLSDSFDVNVNAIVLTYIRTEGGEELITKTAIISEEVEKKRIKKKKFQIPMSDEPGNHGKDQLKELLKRYLSQNLPSATRIREILLPAGLRRDRLSRDELKREFVNHDEDIDAARADFFLSAISSQVGMLKNDFLRQVIGYDYPNYAWEKDNYYVRDEYQNLVREVLEELEDPVRPKPSPIATD